MAVYLARRSFLFLLASSTAALAADSVDPREIVRKVISAQVENTKRARSYTFLQRTEEREFDGQGKVKSKESKTYDVTMLEGSAYRRLIERNDRPLSAAEEAKEAEKLRRSIEERRHESPAERARRISEYENRYGHSRAMLNEIPDAFDFTLRREELIHSRPVYVIECTPKAGYHGKSTEARIFFPKLKIIVWVDKADHSWVRVDAEVIENITFGFFLFRLAKGAHMQMDQVQVNNEVWLPRWFKIAGSARLGLVKRFNVEHEVTFRNYRKFQSDSQLVSATEVQ